jgi:DNA repair exonuclease SbcCD ATPase subunit
MSEDISHNIPTSEDEQKENSSMTEYLSSPTPDLENSVVSSGLSFGSTFSKIDSTEFKQASKCGVCSKKFTLTSRRHHCRFCGESVCDQHSMKRRNKQGETEKLRICDNCDKEFIREEVRKEVEDEVSKLEIQVIRAREANDKLYKEHYEKTLEASRLELELTKAERLQKQKEQALHDKLMEEQDKGNNARKLVDELTKSLENSRDSEKEMIEKCTSTEKQLENLKNQTESLRERRTELIGQIEHLTSRLKGSLPLDKVREIMCPRCLTRLNQTYKPLTTTESIIPEEDEDSSVIG